MTEKERDGVNIVWLACFIRECPGNAVIRGYEGEFVGMVIEMPPENPTFDGQMVELAIIHNDCRVEITSEGEKFGLTAEQIFEI